MPSQSLVRGVVLAGIALAFGAVALRMPIGRLSQSGPGLFPLIVSGMLLALASMTILTSRATASPPFSLNIRNISFVAAALVGFVFCSTSLDMAAGIIWLVFVSTFAGHAYSWTRNLKLSVALIAIGYVFQRFFGLNLGLL